VVAASEDVADLAGFFAEQLGDLEPRYEQALAELGCDPDDYVPLPLHPWQWDNCISTIFFAQLISRDLVYIGTSSDLFRPQQSLRTFFNHSRPALPYVKTAVGIRNMGFVRGLSPAYMETTPAINDWLSQQLNVDPEFRACNVRLLKEIVAVGYRGDTHHRPPPPHPPPGAPRGRCRGDAYRCRQGPRAPDPQALPRLQGPRLAHRHCDQ